MYYKDMEVWKESIKLVTSIYKSSENLPKSELFGLTSQIRRSVVSVPSNIAEGSVKHSDKETLRFLDIALGSLAELDTQIIIANQIYCIQEYEMIETQISKVRALISGLIKYYNTKKEKNLVP